MSQSQLRRLAHPGFRSLARLVVAAIASVALGTASTSFADVQRMDLDSDGVADVIERSSNPPAASLWLSTRGPMALGTGAVPARTADLHVTSPFASLGSFGDRIWYSSDANAGCGERISFLTGIQVGNDTDAVELVYCLDGGELLGGFIWADAGDLLGAATPSGGARELTVDGASVSLEQAMAAQAANSGPSSSGGGISTTAPLRFVARASGAFAGKEMRRFWPEGVSAAIRRGPKPSIDAASEGIRSATAEPKGRCSVSTRICWINATTGESDCGRF